MSQPLAMIGDAVLEMIGLNPQGFEEDGEATWAGLPVFDDDVFWQATANGEKRISVKLACRPHVMGGMDQYDALKAVRDARKPVPFLRMYGSAATYEGLVGVRRISHTESRPAPDGQGYRHEFTVEMIVIGRNSQGGF